MQVLSPTSHISSTIYLHVVRGYCIEQDRYRIFLSLQKVLLGTSLVVVKDLPCNSENVGSIPGWGSKIPHVSKQLSLHAITSKPMCIS